MKRYEKTIEVYTVMMGNEGGKREERGGDGG